MPLEVCKLSRSSRSTVCRESYFISPDRGFYASQNSTCYGYKLHAVCSTDGIFTDFDLTQASVHDIHYLKDIKQLYQNCTILGDKGYLSIDDQRDLFTYNQINMEVPIRKNQQGYKPQPYILENPESASKPYFHNCAINL